MGRFRRRDFRAQGPEGDKGNNLAIFRETFSLPYFENDVMSENLQRARQIVYVIPKLFFPPHLKLYFPLT